METVRVAEDFSRFPAGRFRTDGRFSGEAFRDDALVPALERGGTVQVRLDGIAGCGSGWLDEVFGGLIRERGMDREDLRRRLFVRADEPGLARHVRLAERRMDEAAARKRPAEAA